MDPPSSKPQYTIEDFLSNRRIAVTYDRSEAFKEICEWLIANGYDNHQTIQDNVLESGRAICYNYNGHTWVQTGSISTMQLLGYEIVSASDIVDFLPGFDFGLSDILSLMEES